MDIHQVGWFPPPYGGVSVHISRLRKRLLAAGHRCTVWGNHDRPEEGLHPLGSIAQRIWRLNQIDQRAIIHFHDHYLPAGILAWRGRKVLQSVHNPWINQWRQPGRFPRQWLSRRLTCHFFPHVRHLIAESEFVRQELVKFGFDPARVLALNSCLPPEDDELPEPANVEAFERFRARFGLVVTANATSLRYFEGADMYGIDLCLHMLQRLGKKYPDLGLALAITQAKGTAHLAGLRKLADDLGVSDRVVWLLEGGAYHPILRKCDLFLRPTNSDGFGCSITEAFYFGVPAVASDVIARPSGCLTFRNRDLDDLIRQVEYVFAHQQEMRQRSLASREPDHFPEFLAIYERLEAGQEPWEGCPAM